MRHYILGALLLAGLASCDGSDPTPLTPTGGTWVWASSTIVTTTPNGTVTSLSKNVIPNTVGLVFTSDGKAIATIDKSVSPTGATLTQTGIYTFSGGVVTITYPATSAGSLPYGQVSTALTDHSLTLVHTDQTSGFVYVTTDTYNR